MALSKTLQYTPFEEISFGFGTGEIAAAHPTLTDVLVTIQVNQPSDFAINDGHISTPSYGSSTSSFHKSNMTWRSQGTVADVDQILSQLKFFPSDYADLRTWQPTQWKPNNTVGSYTLENPSDSVTVPTTNLSLRVYDANNIGAGAITTYPISIAADQAAVDWDNVRPWFESSFSTEGLPNTTLTHSLDLSSVSHGTDTENVSVKCSFLRISDDSVIQSPTEYGYFSNSDGVYIGSKKPLPLGYTDDRLNFTGTAAEASEYLKAITYHSNANEIAFKMKLTVSDGTVGSYDYKYIWFPKNITTSGFPDQSAAEDYPATLNLGTSFQLTNTHTMEETDSWSVTFSIDATGQSGIQSVTGVNTTYSSGDIVVTANDHQTLLSYIETVEITFVPDWATSFTFDVVFEAENATIGTSYSSVSETVDFVVTNLPEYSFTAAPAITWYEDKQLWFDTGLRITDNAYGGTAEYSAELKFFDGNNDPVTQLELNDILFDYGVWDEVNYKLVINGTRNQVNGTLENILMTPDLDWISSPTGGFTLKYKITRTTDSVTAGFPNFDIGQPFNAGINLPALDIPNPLYFHGDSAVIGEALFTGGTHPSLSYINGSWTIQEETTPNDTTYEVEFSLPDNFDGTLVVEDQIIDLGDPYVEGDYVDAGYSTISFKTGLYPKQRIISMLNTIKLTNYSNDFTLYWSLLRNGVFNDSGSVSAINLDAPTTSNWGLNTSSMTSLDTDSVYYDYTGTSTITLEDYEIKSYRDFEKTQQTDVTALGQIGQDDYTVTHNAVGKQIDVSFDATAAEFTQVENEAQYETHKYMLKLSGGPEQNPVYKILSGSRMLFDTTLTPQYFTGVGFGGFDINQEYLLSGYPAAGGPVYDDPVDLIPWKPHFVPETLDSLKVNKVNFASTYLEYVDLGYYGDEFVPKLGNISFKLGSDYRTSVTRDANSNSQNWFNAVPLYTELQRFPVYDEQFNFLYDDFIGTPKIVVDSFFGCHPLTVDGTQKIRFVTTNLEATDDPTSTDIIVHPDTTTDISFNTSWGTASQVVDVLYQPDGLYFYALIVNVETYSWKLIRAKCLSSIRYDTNTPIEVVASGQQKVKSGSIGLTDDNEVYVIISNFTSGKFDIYHQNKGGADNFGFHSEINKPTWTADGKSFNVFFDSVNIKTFPSYIKANTTGYIAIHKGLWYFDRATDTWIETVSGFTTDTTPELYRTGLSKDYWIQHLSYPANSFEVHNMIVKELNGSQSPVNTLEISGYWVDASKHDNAIFTQEQNRVITAPGVITQSARRSSITRLPHKIK